MNFQTIGDPSLLTNLLREWSNRYYNFGDSPVDDATFDAAKKRLETLDPDHPFLKEVGAPVASSRTHHHKIPMGSLDNLHNEDEFRRWWDKIKPESVVIQHKYDGASIGLEYHDGRLTRALTRGDGTTGEDITKNMVHCYHHVHPEHSIETLSQEFTGSVRGEAIIFKDDWEKHFVGESNPRNSTTGAIRKENSERVQWVRVFCYDLLNGITFSTEIEKLEYMCAMGLPVGESIVATSPEEVIEFYELTIRKRQSMDYAIDGLVIKINNIAHQQSLGTRNNCPKWAMAFKFPSSTGTSILTDIVLTVGHTGAIIPTAQYRPINLDGRTFTHALLDNFDFIEKHDVAVGDEVAIEIAGDVIPRITGIVKKNVAGCFPRPTNCPVCDGRTEIRGASTKCTNPSCPAKGLAKINQWIKKTGIKYFGSARQKECFEAGLVMNPADLYVLTPESLGEIIGPGNAKHVLEEINSCRRLDLSVFMGSLGIPFLGRRNAQKLIAAGIDTLDQFLSLTPDNRVPGFADNLHDLCCGIQDNRELIQKLLDAGIKIVEPRASIESKSTIVSKSVSFCFTGFRLHGTEKNLFIEKGWVEKSGVSRDLDYLVAKDINGNSSKIKKARDYDVNIISIDDFRQMMRGTI